MKEITLKAAVKNIGMLTDFLDEALQRAGCSLKEQMQIDVAIDELFSNIARYAYEAGEGDATVRFDFDDQTRMVSITFEDSGIAFDPLGVEEPNVTGPASTRAIGGLGIYLVRKTMDHVEYTRQDGKNIVTIRKKI